VSEPVYLLPEAAVTTAAAVKARLGIEDDDDDVDLDVIVAAVDGFVRGLPVAQTVAAEVAPESWPAVLTLGATMLAARLLRRKNSPEGVAVFGADGPVYVQRNDPDVAMLLALGDWSRPSVG
jgi:hypothetical protein